MARANRNHLPGYVWHITHNRHKREFLLKFVGNMGTVMIICMSKKREVFLLPPFLLELEWTLTHGIAMALEVKGERLNRLESWKSPNSI